MECWQYLYENTLLPTNEIEGILNTTKDSIRQKARRLYTYEYRKDRERKVRGWPEDHPKWDLLYENTMMTHADIAKFTGMSVKQLHTRIKRKYDKETRKRRNSLNKCEAVKANRTGAIGECATTIESYAQRG